MSYTDDGQLTNVVLSFGVVRRILEKYKLKDFSLRDFLRCNEFGVSNDAVFYYPGSYIHPLIKCFPHIHKIGIDLDLLGCKKIRPEFLEWEHAVAKLDGYNLPELEKKPRLVNGNALDHLDEYPCYAASVLLCGRKRGPLNPHYENIINLFTYYSAKEDMPLDKEITKQALKTDKTFYI